MTRYTRLEQAAIEALAHDLRAEIPDLARQFHAGRPSLRRNSGFGLFTEVLPDRARPVSTSGPSGDLGTVHVMVGNLRDPVAFRVRVRQGLLLGLLGDSYGQDTRAIDFATVPFDQVFTVDPSGRSIPFEVTRPAPARALSDPPRRSESARPRAAEPSRPTVVRPVPEPAQSPPRRDPPPEQVAAPIVFNDAALLIGLWTLIAVTSLIIVTIFRLPLVFGVFAALFAGRAVRDPKILARVRAAIERWQASQSSNAG